MARIVRQSKFRHVFGQAEKPDKCFSDIRITKSAWDSNFCVVNPKFLAVSIEGGGGGPFLVLTHEETGRIPKSKAIFDGHAAPVLDLAWSPFNDNIIATCSEDCTIKIWVIPDGGISETTREAQLTLTGHQKRVLIVSWHPVAENVLLSAGADNMMVLWDVGNGCALTEIGCHSDNPLSVSWNYDGSLLATTCKDKYLRVIDPRSTEVVQERKAAHAGTKTSKVVFLKDGRILTFGFSKMSDRQYALWDSGDLSQPIVIEDIDKASGVIFPFYDPDTEIVYAAGKGDGSIRYFEITEEEPYIHYISTYSSQQSQRGLGWMPKRGCDTTRCEVVRMYKLHANKIEPISFTVPRKSELFQADIYPDTVSADPAISCEEWWSGTNATPKLMDMGTLHEQQSGITRSNSSKMGGMSMKGKGTGLGSKFGAMNGGGLNGSRSGNSSPVVPSSSKFSKNASPIEQDREQQEPQRSGGSIKNSPFFQNQSVNSSGMPVQNSTLPSIKKANSAGPQQAPDLSQILPDGLNLSDVLDDIKKLKATVKKQGRRIAQLEQLCGVSKDGV